MPMRTAEILVAFALCPALFGQTANDAPYLNSALPAENGAPPTSWGA